MRKAQRGDRRAYHTLLVEVAALVGDFARHRFRRSDWAEEIVQETLLSIHVSRHTYEPERPFGPWMYSIARHRLYDFAEKQRRRSEIEVLGQAGMEQPGRPVTIADDLGSAEVLRQALARLSENQREVIRMLKLEERSVAEISIRTGLTASSVKVTAHRGYKKLRKLLTRSSR